MYELVERWRMDKRLPGSAPLRSLLGSLMSSRRIGKGIGVGSIGLALSLIAIMLSPIGVPLLSVGTLLPASEPRWLIVAQADDCADALRLAMRRARTRGYIVPKRKVFLTLGESQPFSRAEAMTLGGVRLRALKWNLWLRGMRATPVLVDIPSGHWFGSAIALGQ